MKGEGGGETNGSHLRTDTNADPVDLSGCWHLVLFFHAPLAELKMEYRRHAGNRSFPAWLFHLLISKKTGFKNGIKV